MLALRLAVSNFKKKLNVQVSCITLIMISTMLLVVGMVLLFYIPGYYDESNERLKEPHYIVRINDNSYDRDFLKTMKQDPRVEQAEAIDCVIMDNTEFSKDEGKMLVFASFFNADAQQPFFQFQPLVKDESIDGGEAIFMPMSFKQQGYQIGDQVRFEVKKKTFDFKVAGFFETTWFGSSGSSLYNFYVHEEAYRSLKTESGGGVIMAARLHDKSQTDAFAADFRKSSGIDFGTPSRDLSVLESTIGTMKTVTTTFINIFSVLALLISAIILAISFLVIWFGITNHIEEQIRQMGVLGALGYTGFEIRCSIVMEYMLSVFIGGILGIVLSYGALALLGTLLSGTLGVLWKNPMHFAYDLFGFLFIALAVAFISYLASGKIKRLTPVAALRNGTSSHHFRKNYFPLWEGGGGNLRLQIQLAVKTVLHAPAQYLAFGGIVLCVAFVLSFSMILYQGLGVDNSGFIRLAGMEISDATAYLAPHRDAGEIREKMERLDEVDGTSVFQNGSFTVDGITMGGFVSDDFSELRTYHVYEGVMPVYDNEITLTGIVAEKLGKKVGDTVIVEMDGGEAAYLISGLNQTLNNFGLQCTMTLQGARRLNPSIEITSLCVYLKEGVSYEDYSASVENNFKFMNGEKNTKELTPEESLRVKTEEKIADLLTMYGVDSAQYALMEDGGIILSGDTGMFELDSIENTRVLINTNMQLYVTMIRVLTVLLTVLTAGIIALILHFMVKLSMVRRKRELGIYKAMGYTSGQLMLQIAFCYLPLSVPGVLLGCGAAGVGTNGLMSWLLKAVGVSRIGFTISPILLSLSGAAILIFIFLTAFAGARKVRKISVYELFTE